MRYQPISIKTHFFLLKTIIFLQDLMHAAYLKEHKKKQHGSYNGAMRYTKVIKTISKWYLFWIKSLAKSLAYYWKEH